MTNASLGCGPDGLVVCENVSVIVELERVVVEVDCIFTSFVVVVAFLKDEPRKMRWLREVESRLDELINTKTQRTKPTMKRIRIKFGLEEKNFFTIDMR